MSFWKIPIISPATSFFSRGIILFDAAFFIHVLSRKAGFLRSVTPLWKGQGVGVVGVDPDVHPPSPPGGWGGEGMDILDPKAGKM